MALDVSRVDRNDSVEYFWGGELTRDAPELIWDMKADLNEDEEDEDFPIHTLFLKVVTLGKSAVSKEENIVQVEAVSYNNIMVKQPLVNLVAGVNNTVPLDVSFTGKVKTTFRLIEGSGPVYLSGHHLVELPKEDLSRDESMYGDEVTELSEELEDDDDDDEDENLSKLKSKSKKRRNSSSPYPKISKAKKSKMEANDSDSEDDEESEDSEDDEEFDLSVLQKKKKVKVGQSKKEKGSTAVAKAGKKAKKPPAKK